MPPSSHVPFGNDAVSQSWTHPTWSGEQHPFTSHSQPKDLEQEAVAAYGFPNSEYSSTTPIPRSSFFELGSRYSRSEQQPLFESPNSRGSDSFGSGRGSMAAQQSQQTRFAVNCTELELGPEPDDDLHDPGKMPPVSGRSRLQYDGARIKKSHRSNLLGVANALAVILVLGALLFVFAGWPIMTEYRSDPDRYNQGTNNTGQVPTLNLGGSYSGLIDSDTPDTARTVVGIDGDEYHLVFSDEFEEEGRTFGPGDDPYWEAVNLHYAATGDMEYYRNDRVVTRDGSAVFRLDWEDPDTNGNLAFTSGMLQSWNKFCFRGGYIEFRASFPGDQESRGFWAAGWIMGNLGRPGYLASTMGTWPYSYEACDIGTLSNQTYASDESQPAAAEDLSMLPGQKFSACTCQGEDHPGPKKSNGSFVARSAPEVDLWEVATNFNSQSFQVGPFDADWTMFNDSRSVTVNEDNDFNTEINSWKGNPYQEAASCVSEVPVRGFGGDYMTWGLELEMSEGDDYDGHISWVNDGQLAWTMHERALRANPDTEISQRIVPREPMTVVLNFALSENFGAGLDFSTLDIPAEMLVDYVRIYQKPGHYDLGCDGIDGNWPTTEYINNHLEPYLNPNLTLWDDTEYEWPRNALIDNCDN